jgi:CoA-dependent NAD(P)H sulfur oxidoreductase
MKFVIIGGDAAGMSAASRARRRYKDLEIIVLEKSTDVSYSACGMPYNLADPSRSMDDLMVRSPAQFIENGIDLRLNHLVEKIDRKNKKVSGRIGTHDAFSVEYDKLLIATGAKARQLTIPGINSPGIFHLRSLEDGRRIKHYMQANSVKSALIIGSGYIGLEVAEALHERSIKVTLMDIRTEFMPWMPHEMSLLVENELKSKNVDVILGEEACDIQQTNGQLKINTRRADFPVDMVLVGIGIEPCSALAVEAGLQLGPFKSIAIDEFLHTSDPDIFAAGDCADAFHVITKKRVWIPLALRANRTGWTVADNLLEDKVTIPGILGTSVFKVMDYEVARTGLSLGEAEQSDYQADELFIQSRSRAHTHPGNQDIFVHLVADRRTHKLLGANIVGKEGAAHRIDALAVALHSGMTVKEFSECDLAYAPPFSPVWDPMLTAAIQLEKKLLLPEKKPEIMIEPE